MHRLFLLYLIMLAAFPASAKHSNSCADAQKIRYRKSNVKTTIASPLLNLYDVKYVRLDLSLTNQTTALGGNALTRAIVTDVAGMSRYAFELSDQLIIDSMTLNGLRLAPVRIDTDLYAVTLPAPLGLGASFIAQVFYHGRPDNGTGFFTRGVNHRVLGTGTQITFTLSDADLARDWWPCKQVLTDKIDSVDLLFTVPAGTKAGSNGLLHAVIPGAGTERYEWKTRYPIDYYLISVSVAPYAEHKHTMRFSGSTDSMPVQHYIYDTAALAPGYRAVLDSTANIIDYFSDLFGRYPFWKEKYGHCLAPLGGGMEHQTMSTLGFLSTGLIAHELGHQWWGNHVTYASWRDIWLSEGWASYSETLFRERFSGAAAGLSSRTGHFNIVMSRPGGTVYVDDTTDIKRVFDGRLTYSKGAAVAHMLRYIAPSDSVFYSGLRAYQRQYANGLATTADFQAMMEAAYGRSLDTFFQQWIYKEGYPTYSASWNQRGSDVFVSLVQTGSTPASVSAFNMPVTLRLSSSSGDTLVKVPFRTAQGLYQFRWSRPMTNLVIDPNNDIVNRVGSIAQDPALYIGTISPAHIQIAPNPASDSWALSGIAAGTTVQLLDAGGRVVYAKANAPERLNIDSSSLAPGIYTLKLSHDRSGVITRKLLKQ